MIPAAVLSPTRLRELECCLELAKQMNAELQDLVGHTGSLVADQRQKLDKLLVEIEKQELEEQCLEFLEKTLEMLEELRVEKSSSWNGVLIR